MGRILKALNQEEYRPRCDAEPAFQPRAEQPAPERAAEEETDEEVPFIEVGGPRKIIEASPCVLAAAPPVRKPIPVAPIGPRPAPQSGLKSVTFRPLTPDQLPPAPGRFAAELIAFHQPAHALSEGYRALHQEVRRQTTAGRPRALLFTAPCPGTGATTVLLNLAITAAREGDVAVVDANRRRPDVAARLGLSAAPGLREVLTGRVSLPQALQETGLENLRALTAGRVSKDGVVRLVVEAVPVVLRLLREQFPLVLVDAPAWDEGPEAAALASACDAVCLVVEQARAEAPEVARLLQALRHQGSPLCGCILTQW